MEEAERTVWRTLTGAYKDLNAEQKGCGERKILSDEEHTDIFRNIRLRHYLTPRCNLDCFFCSNEGLSYDTRQDNPARLELITALSDVMLQDTSVKAVDFGGGEPLLHPDFAKGEYRLIDWMKQYPNVRFAIHSNGVLLVPQHIDQITPVFSRIGVSVNSVNFDTWNAITNPNGRHSRAMQQKKFDQLVGNLEYLAAKGVGDKVFMKAVIMKGVNDSHKELSAFLETCSEYEFHPKFLQFEPQFPEQRSLIVPRDQFLSCLENAGCEIPEDTPRTNDPLQYCPTITFNYKQAKLGNHSIIGCGEIGACVACHKYICIYIKPTSTGEGLYIKPCSVLDTRIDLTYAIETGNRKQIVDLIKMSREYLILAPGLGTPSWNKTRSGC